MEKDLFEEDKMDEKSEETSTSEDNEMFDAENEDVVSEKSDIEEELNDKEDLFFVDEDAEDMETHSDDDESWIPLKNEGVDSSGAEENEGFFDDGKEEPPEIDDLLTGKKEVTIELDEAFGDIEEKDLDEVLEEEEKETIEEMAQGHPSDEEQTADSSDDEAWAPLYDKEMGMSISDKHKSEGIEKDEDDIAGAERAKEFAELEEEGPEIPPWEEGVEIPDHGEGDTLKKKKSAVFFGLLVLVGLIAVAAAYLFLETRPMPFKMDKEINDQASPLVTKKMENLPIEETEPVKEQGTRPESEQAAEKENSAPNISGIPQSSVTEGTAFSFAPLASDPDPDDKLAFFIANQPAWMRFDTATGVLSGTPGQKDIGAYKNIVILTSDGTSTVSLPAFDITVIGMKKEVNKTDMVEVQQPKVAPDKKTDKEKDIIQIPMEKKPEPQKAETSKHTFADYRDLIKKSEFQQAAKAYHNKLKRFSSAYSYKLEVVCLDESVQLAFEKVNFDQRMFIIPKQLKDKSCFVVFWGIYDTKKAALEAISSIPDFFERQPTKPLLVAIKQYL